jgi:hypothetical protein
MESLDKAIPEAGDIMVAPGQQVNYSLNQVFVCMVAGEAAAPEKKE